MSKQALNIGSAANDNTGDTLRAGGDKVNDNFTEIYGALGNGIDIQVDISNAASGQLLRYNGTNFVASDLTNLTTALDVNGNSIISSSNGNISFAPNGTGDVIISNGSVTNTFDGATGDIDLPTKVKYKNEYASLGAAPAAVNYPGYFFTVDGDDRPYVNINITAGGVGDTRAALLTQYSGIDDLSDVDTTTVAPTDGQTLIWDNTNSKWEPGILANIANSSLANSAITINNTLVPLGGSITIEGGGGGGGGGGIAEVSSDTTPQLGGNLDLNGNDIIGTGNIDITGRLRVPGGTGTSNRIELGNTQEFSLQYDTTSSGGIISTGGNPIDIKATAIRLKSNLDEDILIGTTNDAVELYYDGSKKFETTSTGAIVTGDNLATGFKLNTNYNGYTGLTGSVGDIKRINEHPHYYDGTTWRPFYLSGTPLSVTTSDVNFDDVQVRMDFEQGTVPFNHVNQRNAKILNTNNAADISIVSNPTKFGTKCLKLFTAGGNWDQDYFRWQSRRNSIYFSNWSDPPINSLPEVWNNVKRGGSLDWSQDWTLEFWVRFEDIGTTNLNQRGIFFTHDPSNVTNGSQGLVIKEGVQGAWALYWYNYRGGLSKQIQLEPSSTANYQASTWYFISLTYDASTGEFLLHKNGINVTPTGANTPIDLDVDACNSEGTGAETNDFRTYFGKFMTQDGGAFNFEYSNQMYLDDLRITQFARYDSTNYAPPTAALPITADAPPTVDPDWSNVIVRSTFDTNSNNIAAGAPNGGVPHFQHSTSQILTTGQKYGAGALRHDNGAAYLNYFNQASPLDPSGTWTIEFWFRLESFTIGGGVGSDVRTIWSQSYGSSTGDYSFGYRYSNNNYAYNTVSQNAFKFFWRNGSTLSDLHSDPIPIDILDDYNHVAVVRNGNGDIVVYFNGYKLRHNTSDTTVFTDNTITYQTNASMRIGDPEDDYSAYDLSFNGYIDDLRITTTVKYTENFTPPSGSLPTTGTITNDPPGSPTSGFLTYPTGNGTSGQVLTSDGNGNVTWSAITEADTLDTVATRGNTTTQSITLTGSGSRRLDIQNNSNYGISLNASPGVGINTNAGIGLGIGFISTNAWYAEISGSTGNIDTRGNITADGSLTAGGLTYPTANGASGQVLTSTGAGGVTWADVPGSTLTWTLGADGSSHFTFSGPGFPTTTNDPTLYVMRGMTYAFDNTANGSSHPFRIQSTTGTSGTPYTSGTSGSGTSILYWTVPMNAPNTLYYQCTSHSLMQGTITVVS